jgi:hypothetical protein
MGLLEASFVPRKCDYPFETRIHLAIPYNPGIMSFFLNAERQAPK